MKYPAYTIVLMSLILMAMTMAEAKSSHKCPANDIQIFDEYSTCFLVKPADAMVGDSVVVNCVRKIRSDGWNASPIAGARLSITGYNEDLEPMQSDIVSTREDGTYEFTPHIAGEYLIQVSSCDYSATLTVEERPETINVLENKTDGTGLDDTGNGTGNSTVNITAGSGTDDSGAGAGESPGGAGTGPTGAFAAAGPVGGNSQEGITGGFLDVVMNGRDDETARETAMDFVELLTGFIIA